MESYSRTVRWLVWGGLAVVILAVLFAFIREQRAPGSSPAESGLAKRDLPVISQLSDFTLTNQLAQPVGLAKFANKVWFADIIFTRCPGPCPVMTKRMTELQAHFTDEPDVAFATLTTDPGHDTPKPSCNALPSASERMPSAGNSSPATSRRSCAWPWTG